LTEDAGSVPGIEPFVEADTKEFMVLPHGRGIPWFGVVFCPKFPVMFPFLDKRAGEGIIQPPGDKAEAVGLIPVRKLVPGNIGLCKGIEERSWGVV